MPGVVLFEIMTVLFSACREVEDFARRLNSVWPERMHLGQDRRIESGNGYLHKLPFFFVDRQISKFGFCY
jgi:hypothetical protein